METEEWDEIKHHVEARTRQTKGSKISNTCYEEPSLTCGWLTFASTSLEAGSSERAVAAFLLYRRQHTPVQLKKLTSEPSVGGLRSGNLRKRVLGHSNRASNVGV